jgi:hypothetical protein
MSVIPSLRRKAEGLQIQGQPGLKVKILAQRKKRLLMACKVVKKINGLKNTMQNTEIVTKGIKHPFPIKNYSQAPVAHASNPSYLED